MGWTEVAQRQPGSNTARPMTAPPTLMSSRRPRGNSRTSSGSPKLLRSAVSVVVAAAAWAMIASLAENPTRGHATTIGAVEGDAEYADRRMRRDRDGAPARERPA